MAEFKIGDIIELEFGKLQNHGFVQVNLTRNTIYKLLEKDIDGCFYIMNNIGIETRVNTIWMKKVENKMEAQIGDKVIVEFEASIIDKRSNSVYVKLEDLPTGCWNTAWIKNTSIKEILSRPFKVGDKVEHIYSNDSVAIIIAIDEDQAWLKFDNSKGVFELKDCRHYEE